MKTVRTHAIVLRRTNYGEADRIVQLLTPDGRRSVMARGVRREKSKLAGGVELLAINDVVIGEGKGDLGVLTSARLVQFYGRIMQDYDRLQFVYFVIKEIARASEMVDEPEWYELLAEILMALDAQTIPLALTETWFYLHFASVMGHELNLERDIAGERLGAEHTYRYDVGEQGLRLALDGELTAEHIKLLRLIATKSLKVLAQVGGIGEILPACMHTARAHAAL